jgi:hypothetical protein
MEPRNRCQGINSASLCSMAGRYDNPIPTRCLAPTDFLKIPALGSNPDISWATPPFQPRRQDFVIIIAIHEPNHVKRTSPLCQSERLHFKYKVRSIFGTLEFWTVFSDNFFCALKRLRELRAGDPPFSRSGNPLLRSQIIRHPEVG